MHGKCDFESNISPTIIDFKLRLNEIVAKSFELHKTIGVRSAMGEYLVSHHDNIINYVPSVTTTARQRVGHEQTRGFGKGRWDTATAPSSFAPNASESG